MTIMVSQELEARLREAATRRGLDPASYATQLIEQGLGAGKGDQATLDLLDQWDREEATDDPAEIARRRLEAEEFMQSLARSRAEMEGPDARKIWP